MKQKIIFVLCLFAFQNTNAGDTLKLEHKTINHSIRRVVLWRVYTDSLDSNALMPVKIDSVLRENFHSEKKFILFGKEKLNKIKPNTYYFMLTLAGCDPDEDYINKCNSSGRFWLIFPEKDNLLFDTPKNRELLSKKFDGLKLKYEYTKERPVPRGKDGKSRDIDL